MAASTEQSGTAGKADEEQKKASRREEQASIVSGLQRELQSDEHMLAFLRGRIAGGWRGKLNMGLEAFFAPVINVGLTDQRVILQHVSEQTGKPGAIESHRFLFSEIQRISFQDIETFGQEPAGRLMVRLANDQHIRIRLHGEANVKSAQTLVEVFRSMTAAQRQSEAPGSHCSACGHPLDSISKFCPYCGFRLEQAVAETSSSGQNGPDPFETPSAGTTPYPPSSPAFGSFPILPTNPLASPNPLDSPAAFGGAVPPDPFIAPPSLHTDQASPIDPIPPLDSWDTATQPVPPTPPTPPAPPTPVEPPVPPTPPTPPTPAGAGFVMSEDPFETSGLSQSEANADSAAPPAASPADDAKSKTPAAPRGVSIRW